jgi:hypothetical protein
MAYVYRHIRLDKNEPFYIGIGTDSNFERAYEKYNCRRNKIWMAIMNKSEYDVEILFSDISNEDAKQKEIEFITLYGRKDLGTGTLANRTSGGDGIKDRAITPEYRKKLSDACKRQNRDMRPLIELSANLRRGKKLPPEFGLKISARLKGVPKSEQHKIAGSIVKCGEKNPMHGRKGNNCPAFRGYIEAVKDGVVIGTFRGVHDAASGLKVTATKISACLNGKRKTTGGYSYRRI